MIQTMRPTRSEQMASRLVGFDVVQRTLIEQTLTKLYNNLQAKCQLKIELASQQLMPVFVRQLIDSVPRAVIVEVNCGFGFLSNYLSLCCPDTHIVGIDTNIDKIAEAKKSVSARQNLQFIGQDMNKIPKIEADLVIVNIDEWDDASVQQLERIHQWLTPGGDLLIRTRHPRTQWQQAFYNIRQFGFEHAFSLPENTYNSSQWQKRISQSGYTCLAEYDAATPLDTRLSKAASLLSSYVWYHAEKPIFKTPANKPSKFNPYTQAPQPTGNLPKLRYAQTQHGSTSQIAHKKEHSKTILNSIIDATSHEGDDVLGYIFSKPWKCLQQEISPA